MRVYIVLCVTVVYVSTARAQPPKDAKPTVDGAIARAESVFAAKMSYTLEMERARSSKVDRLRKHVTFSGSSWISQLDGSGGATVNHNGKWIEFVATPQRSGEVTYSALVQNPAPINANFPSPPFFAGTLWFDETKRFIKQNASDAQHKGVAKIGGVEVVVIEWTVEKDNVHKAFRSVGSVTRDGGTLRLYVAPEYGYALPRVQFIGKSGKVQAQFEASNFQETPAGIHVPKSVSLQDYDAEGPTYSYQYSLHTIALVNEPIDDKEFHIQLPIGTLIQDMRSGINKISRVGDREKTAKDLDDVDPEPPPEPVRFSNRWMYGISAVTLLVIFICGSWLRKRNTPAK